MDTQEKVASSRHIETDSIVDEIEERIKTRKKKPGRIFEGSPQRPQFEGIDQRLQENLSKLYTPENFKRIVRAPADMMLAKTGDPLWNMPDEEAMSLAVPASITAEYWLLLDPKWVALAFFGIAATVAYLPRTIAHMSKVREEKEKREAMENKQ